MFGKISIRSKYNPQYTFKCFEDLQMYLQIVASTDNCYQINV